MKIVFCDDSEEDCLIIKTFLTSKNIQNIFFYTDSVKLMEDIDNLSDCYFVLDLKMPRVNGVELLRFIKDKYPDCFVAIMSSSDNKDDIDLCNRHGCDKYILKDMNLKKFGEAILEIANQIKN